MKTVPEVPLRSFLRKSLYRHGTIVIGRTHPAVPSHRCWASEPYRNHRGPVPSPSAYSFHRSGGFCRPAKPVRRPVQLRSILVVSPAFGVWPPRLRRKPGVRPRSNSEHNRLRRESLPPKPGRGGGLALPAPRQLDAWEHWSLRDFGSSSAPAKAQFAQATIGGGPSPLRSAFALG